MLPASPPHPSLDIIWVQVCVCVLNAINACNMRSVPQVVSKRERNANPTTACNLGTLSFVTVQSPPSPHVSVHGYLLCTDNLNMNVRMSFYSVPSSRMD
jgi:hypothetical protein